MWINCDADGEFDIKIKYSIDNSFFEVSSSFDGVNSKENPGLEALFYTDDGFKMFSVGKYNYDNGKFFIEKKYSLSFIKSNNIEIKKFSHFKLHFNNKIISAYPVEVKNDNVYTDRAIIRAKEILTEVNLPEFKSEISFADDFVNESVKAYKRIELPFMKDYSWFLIDNINENFNLSAIEYLLNDYMNSSQNSFWFFGVSPTERIFALAVKSFCDNINPFAAADDCTVVYCNEKNNEFYFVVGLLILDDGQYFCLPE